MRLWHYKLIPYLPRRQLVSQLRECVAIAKSIYEKGTPNHILVNKIMDYNIVDFKLYIQMIVLEMRIRDYHLSQKTLDKVKSYIGVEIYSQNLYGMSLFENWHNDVYLRECLYNLEEKYLCGGISTHDWKIIRSEFEDFTPLV